MSKTLFQQNKETIIGVSLGLLLIVLLVVNLVLILPVFDAIRSQDVIPDDQSPIETETVNKAIEYLK